MEKLVTKLKDEQYKLPFLSAFFMGLIAHGIMLVNKLPNTDSMTNFHFDQNMITSGRWFLTIACGISSYYDLSMVNGLLAIIFLGICAVYVTRFFNIKKRASLILIPGLLVTFPAVCATMSYMYTVDGYMLGLLMAILAVYVTRKYKFGFPFGMLLLAFSMGTYQAYLAFTILLVLFDLILAIIDNEEVKPLFQRGLKYLVMGIGGGVLYYVILKILLAVEHKELDTYQGLDDMGKIALSDIPQRLADVYYDFFAFSFRGRIIVNNAISMTAVCVIIVTCIISVVVLMVKNKSYKKWYNWALVTVFAVLIPFGCNIVIFMSSDPEYHLLMRLQWSLFYIVSVVILERMFTSFESIKEKMNIARTVSVVLVGIICFNFFITDQIAYFNLNEKYEKTYAYCIRLLDRIEQTPGYEQGMPICMVGVVSKDSYPSTDITADYTSKIRGTDGDFLLYRGEQYQTFIEHYLGASLNILSGDAVIDMYYSDEYEEMKSFPDKDSIKIVDGIMYIKLE